MSEHLAAKCYFDGVHMGHQKLIEMIQEKAKQENLLSVVFTFDKIPLRLCPLLQNVHTPFILISMSEHLAAKCYFPGCSCE